MSQRPHHYLIALGTNLGDRKTHLDRARAEINRRIGEVVRLSGSFVTAPMGAADQPFLNAALIVATTLTPAALLSALLAIEKEMGRVRRERWGNRIIDLDVLLWLPAGVSTTTATATYDDPFLKIPHPAMLERPFVLVPAASVAGDWIHPVTLERLDEALNRSPQDFQILRNAANVSPSPPASSQSAL